MNNIIFLDIDGVLVTNNSVNNAICNWYQLNSIDEYDKAKKLRQEQNLYVPKFFGANSQFDQNSVNYLNKLAYLNTKFVISSDWRNSFNIQQLQNIFDLKGLHIPIIDYTPINNKSRHTQITEWVNMHKPDKWCIIDDCPISDELNSKLILTNPDIGISQTNFNDIINILTN